MCKWEGEVTRERYFHRNAISCGVGIGYGAAEE
jgi:hypothetical protein